MLEYALILGVVVLLMIVALVLLGPTPSAIPTWAKAMVEQLLSVALVLVIAGETALSMVALSLILVAASAVLQETSEQGVMAAFNATIASAGTEPVDL